MPKDTEPLSHSKTATYATLSRFAGSKLKNIMIAIPAATTGMLVATGCIQVKDPPSRIDQGICISKEDNNSHTLFEEISEPDQKLVVPASTEYIAIIRDSDSNETTITGPQSDRPFPTFSPDGTKIAFLKDNDLYIVNSDGSEPKRISDYNSDQFVAKGIYPAWTLDQKVVGYVASKDAREYTRFVDLETGQIRDSEAPPGAGIAGFSWSPDGKIYAFVTEDAFLMNINFVHMTENDVYTDKKIGKPPALPHAVRMKWSSDGSSLTYGICTYTQK